MSLFLLENFKFSKSLPVGFKIKLNKNFNKKKWKKLKWKLFSEDTITITKDSRSIMYAYDSQIRYDYKWNHKH